MMRTVPCCLVVLACAAAAAADRPPRQTRISLQDGRWQLNGQVTYPGAPAEGLLLNVRMVNSTFEDARKPDFDPDANTAAFLKQIPAYYAHGVRAFTLCLQGGMPGYEGAVNSAYRPDGSLREEYLRRVARVIDACDEQGIAVILGCYYQRQDQILRDEDAVRQGVVNTVNWIRQQGYTNVLLEVANEYPHNGFDHRILRSPEGEAELLRLAKQTWPELLVSTSGIGNGRLDPPVAQASDFLLIHYNGVAVENIPERIAALKKYGKPIVCNEDDKTGRTAARAAELSVAHGASWGLMLNEKNQYVPFEFDGADDDPLVYARLKELATPAAWKKHVLYSGGSCLTAVAGDFTGDGKADVIANAGGRTRLFVAPDWKEVVLDRERPLGLIHSEVIDADGDGDLDFVGTTYTPGLIFWLEQPDEPLTQPWRYHLIDDQVNGIHGLLVGDVNGDGQPDLLANSAQPTEPFPNSLVWYARPQNAREAKSWPRHVLAQGDAPGLTHYLGLGDVDGDGRADVCTAAKGGPTDTTGMGDWFAWWQAPQDRTQPWKKQGIATSEPGATNIHPADVNGDGQTDFLASRGHDRGVFWFEGPSWRRHDIHPTIFGPHCLVVADLDGDGDSDAATVAKDDRTAAVFLNDGQGRFATHILDRDQAAYDLRAVDLDGDGDLDLLVAGQDSQNVVWYVNPTQR